MIESFQNESKLFIILEYCEAGNLSRVLKRNKGNHLEEDTAKQYICEIILAIEFLHRNNVIYSIKKERIWMIQFVKCL